MQKHARVKLIVLALLTLALTALRVTADEPAEKKPEELAIKLVVPKDPPTRATVNTGYYKLEVELQNNTDTPMTLWPFMGIDVKDAGGNPAPVSMHIGRWGAIGAPSMLEDIKFITLKPGEKHTLPVALNAFTHDADAIRGWKLARGNTYRVALSYSYDRDAAVNKFGKGCAEPDAPDRPWNKARAVKWAEAVELKLD